MPCDLIIKRGSAGVEFLLKDEPPVDSRYTNKQRTDLLKLIPLITFSKGTKTTFDTFCQVYHDQLQKVYVYTTTYIQTMSKLYKHMHITIDQQQLFQSICYYIYMNSHASNKRDVTNYVLRK